jgi:hypothetical protein
MRGGKSGGHNCDRSEYLLFLDYKTGLTNPSAKAITGNTLHESSPYEKNGRNELKQEKESMLKITDGKININEGAFLTVT